jgi:hypothetical protein
MVIHFTDAGTWVSENEIEELRVAVYQATILLRQPPVLLTLMGRECRVIIYYVYHEFANFANDEVANVEGLLYIDGIG